MSLTKQQGNMYDWVTHTHASLIGECPHQCEYCFAKTSAANRILKRYSGPLRLDPKAMKDNLGKGRVIFKEHMNDLFADNVPTQYILDILEHTERFPCNTYVFQTKNPLRATLFQSRIPILAEDTPQQRLPMRAMFGTTMETNRWIPEVMRNSPPPASRHIGMLQMKLKRPDLKLFVTIEPILAFDLEVFADAIVDLRPDFVNIGADSKNNNLPEPTWAEVMALYERLTAAGIAIRKKLNLERLRK